MANIDKIIKSKNLPKQTNVAWVDLSDETPVTKYFINGKWQVAESNELTPEQIDYIVSQVDISGKADKVNTPQIYKANINSLSEDFLRKLKVGDIVRYETSNWIYDYYVSDIITQNDDLYHIDFVHQGQNTLYVTGYSKGIGGQFIKGAHSYPIYDYAKRIPIRTSMATASGDIIEADILYNLGKLTQDTTFNLSSILTEGIVNIYLWTFETGDTVPTITWPDVTWCNSVDTETVGDVVMPVIEPNKHYEINIMDGYGTIISADIPQTEVEP